MKWQERVAHLRSRMRMTSPKWEELKMMDEEIRIYKVKKSCCTDREPVCGFILLVERAAKP